MRVCVSAAAGPIIASVVRHLKNCGHYVIGIDGKNQGVGRFFCDEYYECPVARDRTEFLAFLQKLDNKIDVFFSYVDEELLTIANAIKEKQLGAIASKIFLSPPETLLTCVNKKNFQEWGEANGVSIAPQANTFPAIAKPIHGRGAKGIVFVEDEALFSYFQQREDYICQQVIQGVEYTVDVLTNKQGKYVFGLPRKRLDARGVSITGEISWDEEVIAFCQDLCQKMTFAGPINIQVMREQSSGKLFLIEVNPRLSGSVVFTTQAGFNITEAAIAVFYGREPVLPDLSTIKNGRVFYRFWEDIDESRATIRAAQKL